MEPNWTEWNGGECPVPAGHDVSFKFRDGSIERIDLYETYFWSHSDLETDIIAYFDHTAAEQEKAMDIWKEAPEGAEYYDNEAALFYRLIGNEVQFYYGIARVWTKSALTQSVLNSGLKRNAVIKRQQAEQEEPKEWKDGLPPVGVECEMMYLLTKGERTPSFERVLVKSYYEGQVWFQNTNNSEVVCPLSACTFRPIKSQAEKEREEAINSMIAACPYSGSKSTKIDCEALYDAGYRLDTKGDV